MQRLIAALIALLIVVGGAIIAVARSTGRQAEAGPRPPVATATATVQLDSPTAHVATRTPVVPSATPTPPASATLTARPSATATDTPMWTPTAWPTAVATTTVPPTVTNIPTARPSSTPTAPPVPSTTATASVPVTPTAPLQLGVAQFSLFTINPQFTDEHISFALSTPARVRLRIAQAGDVSHVRTLDLGVQPARTVSVTWDGRDNAHRLVPAGSYTVAITATTGAGQTQSESYDLLGITYKRIVVSLSKQHLWAFDGRHYVLGAPVTTGNPALPTPQGVFPILGKYSPFTFVSPWPYGSKYYYPPSPVNYALLFDDRGYYVHDAPWRSAFGPGTNATLGMPGQNYTGTHGCVNVPEQTMAELYPWATIGTVVQVVP